MFTLHNHHLSLRHRQDTERRPVFIIALAVMAVGCLVAGFVVYFTGYSHAPWAKDLATIALLTIIVWAAALALRAKVQQAAHYSIDSEFSDSQTAQFHIADGGTGLPVKEPRHRSTGKTLPAAYFDGGSFPSHPWLQ